MKEDHIVLASNGKPVQLRPMLAGKFDKDKIEYPVYVQAKIDGIRCLVKGGVGLSRTLKPIPNKAFQSWIASHRDALEGVDGEVVVGDATAPDVYNKTQSGLMSEDGQPDFHFHVFDMWNTPSLGYFSRRDRLWLKVQSMPPGAVCPVQSTIVHSFDQLLGVRDSLVDKGFEGIIIRRAELGYKYGRSTTNEGALIKWKHWEDDEAKIVGYKEFMHNNNAQVDDNFGLSKRSSHLANMIPGNKLGALIVQNPKWEGTFDIGSGFDMATRQQIWDSRPHCLGKIAKFKYFPIGMKDKPRHPIWKGFRDPMDM